jgi:hypothetical protein
VREGERGREREGEGRNEHAQSKGKITGDSAEILLADESLIISSISRIESAWRSSITNARRMIMRMRQSDALFFNFSSVQNLASSKSV